MERYKREGRREGGQVLMVNHQRQLKEQPVTLLGISFVGKKGALQEAKVTERSEMVGIGWGCVGCRDKIPEASE